MEKDYDFLWIYDGDNVYAPKIGRWNTENPGIVQASGNVMCVEFRSDCGETDMGWEAVWRTEMPTPIEPEIPEIEAGVYPNPTNDVFVVKTDNEGFSDVVVYDVYGNQMIPTTRFVGSKEIDASHWPPGVYMVNYGEPVRMGHVVKLVKL